MITQDLENNYHISSLSNCCSNPLVQLHWSSSLKLANIHHTISCCNLYKLPLLQAKLLSRYFTFLFLLSMLSIQLFVLKFVVVLSLIVRLQLLFALLYLQLNLLLQTFLFTLLLPHLRQIFFTVDTECSSSFYINSSQSDV